jgi:hypothetical protein
MGSKPMYNIGHPGTSIWQDNGKAGEDLETSRI